MSGMLMAERFVAVFPSLVRALGDIESAAILQHVYWLTGEDGQARTTAAEINEATGIAERTVRRRLDRLIEDGYLVAERAGKFDAARVFTVVTDHPNLSARGGHSDQQPVKVATSTSSTEVRTPPTPPVPLPEAKISVSDLASWVISSFDVWWEHYPNKTNRRAAFSAYQFVLNQVDVHLRPSLAGDLLEAVDLLVHWEYGGRATSMVPSPVNWLRDQRWNDADQYRGRERAFDLEEAANRGQ
jgi:DNA-binding transcriptional ArsR family regulator